MRTTLTLFLALSLLFPSCDQATLDRALETVSNAGLTEADIARGLREALEKGIARGASELSREGGYFESPYKILLPEEARKVTERLSAVPGFTKVEEEVLRRINAGAEDAAKSAKPIFVDAIRAMSFTDATNILMGQDDAATEYLRRQTYQRLYDAFKPQIISSLDKFNARTYWRDAVNKYNAIPLVEDVNPELDDYVTQQALQGLFTMVALEEENIRDNVAARTSELLRRVFARQD